jgi:hypothetical protein
MYLEELRKYPRDSFDQAKYENVVTYGVDMQIG